LQGAGRTSATLAGVARFEDLLEDFFYRPDEAVGALFDAGPATEGAPAPVEDAPPREYLAFSLGHETYAVPIDRVREIVKVPPLTEIPRSARELLGVVNLRGEVLPVYDLKLRLHLSAAPAPIAGPDADLGALPRSARILIVHDERGDAGVLVDAVWEAVKLRPSSVEPPPRGLGAGERPTIHGIGRRRDQLFILLDLAQALP
jgi:purine-binding chemotaxis protein CheW